MELSIDLFKELGQKLAMISVWIISFDDCLKDV